MASFTLEATPNTSVSLLTAEVGDSRALREAAKSWGDIAVINGELVLNVLQVVTAVGKALSASSQSSGGSEMLTSRLSTEIVYRLSGSGNVVIIIPTGKQG